MAIRIQDLLSSPAPQGLNPFAGIADAFADAQKLTMQKQQLEMSRKQFEEQTRRNREDERLRSMAEQGEQTRATLRAQQEQKAARAKVMQDRSTWAQEFGKQFATGNDSVGYSMVPQAAALGIKVEKQDEVNGRPRFRIDIDPEGTAERERQQQSVWGQAQGAGMDEMDKAGIGYQGTELDAELAAGADPAATEARYLEATGDYAKQRGPEQPEPFSPEVLEATGLPQVSAETGGGTGGPLKPHAGPDTEDFMGAVPNDVIDVPAMQAASMHRLNPAMAGLVNAFPEGEQRESAKSTAEGIKAAGMDVPSSLDLMAKFRGNPDSSYDAMRMAEAQSGRAELDAERRSLERQAKLTEVSVMDQQSMLKNGFSQADEIAVKRKVPDALARRNDLNYVVTVLTDKDPNNDKLLGPQISRLFGDSGAIALADVAAALGTSSQSLIDQGITKLWGVFYGGLKPEQKQAITDTLRARVTSDEKNMFDYMDNVERMAESKGIRPEVAQGYRNYRDTLFTDELRSAWKKRWDATRVKAAPNESQNAGRPKPPPAGAGRGNVNPEAVGEPDSLGSAPLPKQLGEVENALGSWLGDMKHPAIKILAQHFDYDPAGGPPDEAVGEYLATLESDYPEAYVAAKRGDAEGFKRAMTAKPAKPDPANGATDDNAAAVRDILKKLKR